MKLLSVSAVVPSKRVTNECLIDEIMHLSRDHLSRLKLKLAGTLLRKGFVRSGTRERYVRAVGEKAIDLTTQAGEEAIAKAGIKPEDIDLLIYTGVGRGWIEPAMANLFQSQLGLKNATCFDIMDACASWLRSLSVAQSFIDQGTYRTVMILNSEFNNKEFLEFKIKDPKQLHESFAQFTIGEASTATILTADDNPGNFYFSFKTWGEMSHLCQIPLPNAHEYIPENDTKKTGKPMVFFARSGELLSFVVDKLTKHFREDSFLQSQSYDVVFGHDVSDSSTLSLLKGLNLDPSRVFRTHSRFGNTVSASIPLGIATALKENKLQLGSKVLMVCGSAGVSTAYCAFNY